VASKFRFALQAVLDARQRVEDEKKRDLAERRRALDAVDAEIDRITSARERCMAELAASAHTAPVLDLRVRDAHLRRLDAAFAEATLARGDAFAAWESARDAFIAARRARGTLERLKERRRRAFDAEEARREELELDESNERQRRQRAGSAAS